MKKHIGPTALDYMREFTMPEETGLLEAKKLVEQFIKDIEARHEPMTGEAYPEDKNRYCAICMSGDGGSARHPCGTIRSVRSLLGTTEKAGG